MILSADFIGLSRLVLLLKKELNRVNEISSPLVPQPSRAKALRSFVTAEIQHFSGEKERAEGSQRVRDLLELSYSNSATLYVLFTQYSMVDCVVSYFFSSYFVSREFGIRGKSVAPLDL